MSLLFFDVNNIRFSHNVGWKNKRFVWMGNKTFDFPPPVIYYSMYGYSHRKGEFRMKSTMKISFFLAAFLGAGMLSAADNFNNLFRVMAPHGDCQIRRPGQEAFEPVLKGKAYPFGSLLKCGKESDMVITFSEQDAVRVMANSVISAELDREADNRRIVSLKQGDILVRLDVLNTNKSVIVDTPVGRCVSMVGNAKMHLVTTPAEHQLEIRAEASCQVKVVGPQYVIPDLVNGNAISISMPTDSSMTTIRDIIGDYRIFVNKGLEENPDTSAAEASNVLLPVTMSSGSTVKIWREKAPVGGRLIVSVLATGPDGKGRESYAFAVGQNSVVTQSDVFDELPEEGENAAAAVAAPAAGDADADLFAAPASDDLAAEPEAPAAAEAPAQQQDNALDDFLF